MPGYHTNLHRHNHTDEAFYVMEGVLTVKINDTLSDYPAGSYVLIPRGTAHAQGNRGKVPARILLTRRLVDSNDLSKIELTFSKRAKPSDPDLDKSEKRTQLRVVG
jgi:quercetin dioxygenase-like cupin family protein